MQRNDTNDAAQVARQVIQMTVPRNAPTQMAHKDQMARDKRLNARDVEEITSCNVQMNATRDDVARDTRSAAQVAQRKAQIVAREM